MPPRPPLVGIYPPRPPGWPEWLPVLSKSDGNTLVRVRHAVTADEFRCMTARKTQNAFLFRRPPMKPIQPLQPLQPIQPMTLEPSRAAVPPLVQLKGWFGSPDKVAMKRDLSFLGVHQAHIVPFELYLGTGDAAVGAARSLVAFRKWLKKVMFMHRHLAALLGQLLNFEELREGVVTTEFVRFDAPLSLLFAAARYNLHAPREKRLHQLYIAQMPLADLPGQVQLDVPTPECLLASADVYNTSLWLGLEPTFTPWHRDPNPNLFYQVCGTKEIRLMEPARGRQLFADVMQRLGTSSTPNIRGNEIMQGAERQAFVDAVWSYYPEKIMHQMGLFQFRVHPGDVAYIPKGWWHSVRSKGPGSTGSVNASVNWWFRWRASAMSDLVAPDSSEQNPPSPDQPFSGEARSDPDSEPNEAHSLPPGSPTQ